METPQASPVLLLPIVSVADVIPRQRTERQEGGSIFACVSADGNVEKENIGSLRERGRSGRIDALPATTNVDRDY